MLAFTFPGQGSQRPGMGAPWVGHPSWEVVEEASEVTGRDLSRLLLEADLAELTATENAQLATYVLSLVVLDAVERTGLAPLICAGHSLGEYSALTAAGALALEDGARLVAERGAAMHEAASARRGTMAAVLGAEPAVVQEACRAAGGPVWVANDNAPGQVVVAGEPEAVARAGEEAKARGAKRVVAIPVAGAFHTELMAPARERLAKALATVDLADPDVPVVANVDARAHLEGAEWPELLLAQLTSPVRWRESLASVVELGATTLVEVGPGGVLTGLARRAAPAVRAVSVASPEDLELLAEAAAGSDAWGAHRAAHGGERLAASTRLVVSPAAGVFEPAEGTAPVPGPAELDRASADPERGPWLQVGALVGRVGAVEVLSPFDGRLVGLLVHRGERVQPGQPVAWLQADEDPGPGAGAPGSSATAAAGRAEGVR